MFNLDNLRLEYFVELMKNGGTEKWEKSKELDEEGQRLIEQLKTAGPNREKLIMKKIKKVYKKANKLCDKASLYHDIATSLEQSMLDDEVD